MFQMVGAFAEFERELIRERVKLGLKRAKQNGKKLGRPKVKVNKYKIMNLRNQGFNLREIGKQMRVSYVTIHNILKSTS